MTYSDIIARHVNLQAKIDEKIQQCDLSATSVALLAVVKQQPTQKIARLLEHGHRFFAENRVQDAKARWHELKQDYPDIILHHIGALQTNKARDAVMLYDVVETLDRESLAAALDKEASKIGKIQRCLIQVNIGEELQKSGVLPDALAGFIAQCHKYDHLTIEGLMCIPPANKISAPYFALMRQWQQHYGLPHLSMGMSGDFEEAVRFGATHVRIGTKLMGEREVCE